MSVIKPTCLRDLKFRVNIVDVVSRVAALKKAGGRFKGLCPFHNEKTPSFHVDPDKGFYKCFGCGKAGDIITFVRETEQLTFSEAVETLGKRFGVPIEYEEGSGPTREERSLRQELFEIHELAAEHFHTVFKEKSPGNVTGEWMRDYWLNARRFPIELADEFKVGAIDATGTSLAAVLHRKKFSEEALRKCGLFHIYDDQMITVGALRPRFRGRLVIPIRDHQGRVVAFTARQTALTPEDDPSHQAKYVNSPGTPIFTKGDVLFNLDRARAAVGPGHPYLLVEGQLDALRCWHTGLKTAVATQGTAITENHLKLMRRYHTQVECLFDSDAAGQKAALAYLPLALKAGMETRFLSLAGAEKIDPDVLFLQRGAAAADELRAHSLSAMAFACRSVLPDLENASAEQKTHAARTLFELILNAESELTRSQFLAEIASRLRLPPQSVTIDFDAHRRRAATRATAAASAAGSAGAGNAANPTPDSESGTPSSPEDGEDSPEHHLLLLCLHFEQLGKDIAHAILHRDWIDETHIAGELLTSFLNHFEQDDWPGSSHLDPLLHNESEKTLIASLLFDPPQTDEPLRIANQAITSLRNRSLQPRLREIELALSTQQADSTRFDAIALIKERTEIQRQLRQPIELTAAV